MAKKRQTPAERQTKRQWETPNEYADRVLEPETSEVNKRGLAGTLGTVIPGVGGLALDEAGANHAMKAGWTYQATSAIPRMRKVAGALRAGGQAAAAGSAGAALLGAAGWGKAAASLDKSKKWIASVKPEIDKQKAQVARIRSERKVKK